MATQWLLVLVFLSALAVCFCTVADLVLMAGLGPGSESGFRPF